MFKNIKDEVLEDIFKIYKSGFNKNIEKFKSAYICINKKYTQNLLIINAEEKNREKKLKLDLNYIKIEKYRLENNKLGIDSNINAILASFLVLLVVIGITCLPSLYSYFGNDIGFYANSSIICVFSILTLIIYKSMSKYPLQLYIYDLAIKVLEDIEKDIAEYQAKEREESEKLDIQQRIEQYFNVKNEIAATSNRIIGNTKNDKKNKGNKRFSK